MLNVVSLIIKLKVKKLERLDDARDRSLAGAARTKSTRLNLSAFIPRNNRANPFPSVRVLSLDPCILECTTTLVVVGTRPYRIYTPIISS